MSLFAPILAACLLVAIQGLLLQAACTIAGEKPPKFGPALLTAIIAGILAALGTLIWGCTFGLVVGLLSRTLAWFLSVLVGLAITASVYRVRLDTTGPQALAITLAHHAMAWAISGVLYAILAWLR